LILIGPEGDFSNDEIELAEQNNFTGISLGSQRLRTETAALNAVFTCNFVN
jgi:16S rRNA (uracil1498-N3)-methyltransferase